MKFTKTIRGRLLSWIALLLGAMLVALDFAAYEIHLSNRIRLLDETLRGNLASLATAVIRPPRTPNEEKAGRSFGGPPDDFRGEPPTRDDNPSAPKPPHDGPPPQPFSPFSQPPMDEAQFAAVAQRLETSGLSGFYYCLWRGESGASFSGSTNCPAGLSRPPVPDKDTGTYTRTRAGFREAFHVTERGDCLLVGCSLAPELNEARRFAWLLGLGSLAILAVSLGVAGLIITRALQPVKKISDAAVKISSGNLSQRINVTETESELGQLATVLNSTFARLDAAFSRQKQFTADAAHELRTPVTVMLTHAQNGLAAGCECDEHREAFAACQRAAQRMKKLIGALLALARIDDDRVQKRRVKFDLADVVKECASLVEPLAAARNVKISTSMESAEITGDPEQFGLVATNLLTNAIQYNRQDGEVRVELKKQDNRAALLIADTGGGIAPEDLPRVFDRFYRADKSRSGENLGLGLAIAKAIVAAHGGTIEVSSKLDRGTTFAVSLPSEHPSEI